MQKGYLDNNNNNEYSLSVTGKRELQFREFARGYGNAALNNIMNCQFPIANTVEENLIELVEMFGLYCLLFNGSCKAYCR